MTPPTNFSKLVRSTRRWFRQEGAATTDQEDAVTVERDVSPAQTEPRARDIAVYGLTRAAAILEEDAEKLMDRVEQEAAAIERRKVVERAVRFANHGVNPPPNDPCESCALSARAILDALASESDRPTTTTNECPECGGAGGVRHDDDEGERDVCETCGGSGRVASESEPQR